MLPRLLPMVLVSLAAALLVLGLGRWLRAVRLRWRFRRARAREAQAATLLEGAGYDVIAAQVSGACELLQDGEMRVAEVRADYLVRRHGRLYVAEAKSGARAPDPADRATRRQLLEYALVYDVAGVLLVDTEAGRVSRIEFPGLRRRAGFWRGVLVGGALGVCAAYAALGP